MITYLNNTNIGEIRMSVKNTIVDDAPVHSDDPKTKKKNGQGIAGSILDFIGSQFAAFDNNEENKGNLHLEDNPLGVGSNIGNDHSHVSDNPNDDSIAERDSVKDVALPRDRGSRYVLYNEMARDATLSEALDIHLSYALSQDRRTGRCVNLVSTAPEHDEMVREINARLMPIISENLARWTKTMIVYGVGYVRPYAKEGEGITHFQHDYYTLPHFIRRYEKGGLIAGYTSQHLRKTADKSSVQLAPPYSLLELKIPFFHADVSMQPNDHDGQLYSLFDEVFDRKPVETQDYGTSFLEFAYEPWCDFKEALASLIASRRNASRIDRLITAQLDNLDPVAAADYINLIGQQLKSDLTHAEKVNKRSKTRPLINNSIIPVQGGSKGGVTIDQSQTSSDIQHLEDVYLHLKRAVASIGVDLSLVGWGDSVSAALGEGGVMQSSIQAARRSAWIRQACNEFINDAVTLDYWYRNKKLIPNSDTLPWRVEFSSSNTAIKEQDGLERESKANYAVLVASLIDTVMQGSSAKSETLKTELLSGVLDVDGEQIKVILKELNAVPAADEDQLNSSLGGVDQTDLMRALMGKLTEDAL